MRILFRLIKKIIIIFIVTSILLVVIFRFINPPATMLMVTQKIVSWDQKQSHTWIDIEQISDNIKIAVIASEDQNFADHFGFDLNSIEKAIIHNNNSNQVRGASTITQQVAKNLFLWPSRSFIRKGFELWFTLWIELFWSKERILEVYLNSVEWGTGIFGIEAASQHYFQISAKKLTLLQSCLLAAVLPNPRHLSPTRPTQSVLDRARWIELQIQNLNKNIYLEKISS